MIVETLIATVGAVTIVGTLAGLRFAGKHMERESEQDPAEQKAREQRDAVGLVRQCVERDLSSDRDKVRALLVAHPERLPEDVRNRVVQWLNGKAIEVP